MKKSLLVRKLSLHKYFAVTGFVCVFAIAGIILLLQSKAATPFIAINAASGTLNGPASAISDPNAFGGSYVKFGSPITTSSAMCGWEASPPAHYTHVIWIWEENQDSSQVIGSAPYIDKVAGLCGSETNILDSATNPILPSEPAYAAATSGSNCVTGITTNVNGNGCITNDNAYSSSNSLPTESIFQLAKASGGSWKSYQESMPSNCQLTDSPPYVFKHNPAAFYTQIASDCKSQDISMPAISCAASGSQVCSTPSGAFLNDINNGTLPTFSFVTPNLNNDMHDGTVAEGDNWLSTYLPFITAGPNYRAGNTAIFIMWDEGSSNSGSSQDIPSLAIAPSIKPGTVVTKAANNIGILKTTQDALGLTPYLGCASGTPPGNTGICNPGSNVSLITDLNL